MIRIMEKYKLPWFASKIKITFFNATPDHLTANNFLDKKRLNREKQFSSMERIDSIATQK